MAITSRGAISCLSSLLLIGAPLPAAGDAGEKIFVSRQLTPTGEYTFGIEGPAVDADGDLYVVNFRERGTIGRVRRGTVRSELFARLPEGSVGNAIRFASDGTMFVADHRGHSILKFAKGSAKPSVYFHSNAFNQPNDLTVGYDGVIYASDPDWKGRSGRIWRIAADGAGNVVGEVMSSERTMGTTNGIDLSPDGRTLYVGESSSGEIWSYRIDGMRLSSPRRVTSFEPDTVDGLRTDVTGRLFVARIMKGRIAIVTPDGRLGTEVVLQANEPTNVAFGGPEGRDVFVTQRKGGFIETFVSDRAGREHCVVTPGCGAGATR